MIIFTNLSITIMKSPSGTIFIFYTKNCVFLLEVPIFLTLKYFDGFWPLSNGDGSV